jgi:diphosphomevalonate decarboxylase
MIWAASAPSNIALIKYMGKTESSGNRPANPSLSFTLSHLITEVELAEGAVESWKALEKEGFSVHLSQKGEARFLGFFAKLKKQLGIKGNFIIRSGNNFPSDCGLASSASSFAALTLAAYKLSVAQGSAELSLQQLSKIARTGSGSSCRSLFAPWALWQDEGAELVKLPYQNLLHQVVIVEDRQKTVSSSEAHLRVTGSALFAGRPERATLRLQRLIVAMQEKQWRSAFDICWAEFWDMHALFETCEPAFGYMSGGSIDALEIVRRYWEETGDGPLVTMDAGPNVHLLYREDQGEAARIIRGLLQKTSSKVIGNETQSF